MRTLAFAIVGMLLIGVQTTLFQAIPAWLGSPDLVFILVAFLAYRFEIFSGLFLAVLLGWMMDVVSGIYLGTYLVEYMIFFVALKLLALNSPIKESAYQVPLVGAFYFLVQFMLYLVLSILVVEALPPWSWNRVLRETIVLSVAAIPCFLLFNSLNESLVRRRAARRTVRKKSGNQYR